LKKEIKIGLIVVVSVIAIVWGLNFLKGRDVFDNRVELYSVFNKIEGLDVGSAVQINGFNIGNIDNIYFHPDNSGRIIVSFSVNKTNINIPNNSIAKIINSDLLGSKIIQLELKDSPINIKDGDTLTSDVQISLAESVDIQLAPIKKKAEEMMSSIDSAMVVIRAIFNKQTIQNINNSFTNLKSVVGNIENITSNLDTVFTNNKGNLSVFFSNLESISTNLKNNNGVLTNIINNFSSVSDSLAKANIVSTISTANKTLEKCNIVLTDISQGKGSLGMLANDKKLYEDLAQASKNLDILLEDIRLNPHRYLNFSIFGNSKPYKSKQDKKEAKSKKTKSNK